MPDIKWKCFDQLKKIEFKCICCGSNASEEVYNPKEKKVVQEEDDLSAEVFGEGSPEIHEKEL